MAAEQVIPLGRVWSFPKQIVVGNFIPLPAKASVRFIEVYDPGQRRMLCRLDMAGHLFGHLELPTFGARSRRVVSAMDKPALLHREAMPEVPDSVWDLAKNFLREQPLTNDQIRCFFSWRPEPWPLPPGQPSLPPRSRRS